MPYYYHIYLDRWIEAPHSLSRALLAETVYLVEFDMSWKDVMVFSRQYDGGKWVFFKEGCIVCDLIRKVRIFQTPHKSKAYGLKDNDRVKRIFGGEDIKAEGKDVTRQVLTQSYSGESKQKEGRERFTSGRQRLSKNVFVVHGRDHKPMKELKAMLKEFGLNPVVLHEQPSGSRTIVEKLEKYSDVGYAFVILTPDDRALIDTDETKYLREMLGPGDEFILKEKGLWSTFIKERPRQNVVLEFGYFMGLLGRERVCCLHKGNVELASDMHGIVYIPFKESVNEVEDKIVRELKAADYGIKI